MLYLIIGNQKENIDKEINKISKKDDVLKLDAFSWDVDLVRGKLESNSLFGGSGEDEVLVLDNISENTEAWEFLRQITETVVSSEKQVVLIERDLNKEEVEFFDKAKVEIKDLREKKQVEYDFSPFAIQDALGAKDTKSVWIEYIKLRNLGIEAEEITPKLIQKARDMLASNFGASKEDLSIKSDYPYNKSKRDFKNWKPEVLKNFYSRLISIYHEARSIGGENLDVALEREILKI